MKIDNHRLVGEGIRHAESPNQGGPFAGGDPDTIVLPFFILGPSNDLAREISLRFRSAPGHDIRMHWGTPLRCGDLRERSTGAQDLADALLQIVHDLGQQDRAIVARSAGPQ